jgi:glutamate synthase (NADPH/NADH) large chain
MTGGRALILGKTGRNFAAGMSGGIAWIYDPENAFAKNCNQEMVDLDPLDSQDQEQILQLLKKHHTLTGSQVAASLLNNWEQEAGNFIKVFPKEYKRVLNQPKVQQTVRSV